MAERLDEATIAARLAELPGWTRAGDEIRRTFQAPDFLTGVRIVNEVAVAAEAANHHPDIDIRWRRVSFALTTHDAGGLTDLDFDLARRIQTFATEHEAD
ncbi:4a-hydroxytetrahydrobiopterin dehydratase [Actinomadura craniellae]|uniref:Putative pterin-4-alpha-carbinolamine dehydratase n=1 Tax=Actinomadura craniellae TaxID=2231787 RepID=A0A365H715_9ACTN|nr:4a-hydroxytetrahydrobiopterin dehydratase [Actinomadura craniellae]RAY14871.1 4a-hydroxytetrahydrobiopterin dehydratase [Actinomadura craniellae]